MCLAGSLSLIFIVLDHTLTEPVTCCLTHFPQAHSARIDCAYTHTGLIKKKRVFAHSLVLSLPIVEDASPAASSGGASSGSKRQATSADGVQPKAKKAATQRSKGEQETFVNL